MSQFLRSPGTLGLGRAYVEGSLDVDDLDAAFIVVDEWEPPRLSLADRARLGLAVAWPRCRAGCLIARASS